MKQKDKKLKLIGSEAFENYYFSLYESRWNNLKQSLFSENIYTEFHIPECKNYFLDPASVCAALCLPLDNAADVLDMCAAPGGKSLVLSLNLKEEAKLTSNERSGERKKRLESVVSECLPSNIKERIFVTCSDGATLCQNKNLSFDSILLDAPCSSERHVLNDKKYLDEWTPSRIKSLSQMQWALISSAYRLLRNNSFLLYSTCALADSENNQIIARLLKKYPDMSLVSSDEIKNIFNKNLSNAGNVFSEESINLIEKTFSLAEKKDFGFHILPDTASGSGPIYFSLLRKN